MADDTENNPYPVEYTLEGEFPFNLTAADWKAVVARNAAYGFARFIQHIRETPTERITTKALQELLAAGNNWADHGYPGLLDDRDRGPDGAPLPPTEGDDG